MRPAILNLPYLHRGDSWRGFGPVQILFASGDPFAAVANATTNALTAAGHGLSNGDILTVAATGGGLTAGLRLYVISATTDTFQLSLAAGGSAIDLTSAATHLLQRHEPPASELERIWIDFKRDSETGLLGLSLDSEVEDQITIVDATAWKFVVPAQSGPRTAGEYHYDAEFLSADGRQLTYLKGVMIVGQDVTQPPAS